MKKSVAFYICFVLILGAWSFNLACMPLRSLLGYDVPIQDAGFWTNSGEFNVQALNGHLYWRNFDNVRIEKRKDGAPHTSVKFSFTGLTLLVPVEEDVSTWQVKLDEAKAKYAAYLESLKPQRVLPPPY